MENMRVDFQNQSEKGNSYTALQKQSNEPFEYSLQIDSHLNKLNKYKNLLHDLQQFNSLNGHQQNSNQLTNLPLQSLLIPQIPSISTNSSRNEIQKGNLGFKDSVSEGGIQRSSQLDKEKSIERLLSSTSVFIKVLEPHEKGITHPKATVPSLNKNNVPIILIPPHNNYSSSHSVGGAHIQRVSCLSLSSQQPVSSTRHQTQSKQFSLVLHPCNRVQSPANSYTLKSKPTYSQSGFNSARNLSSSAVKGSNLDIRSVYSKKEEDQVRKNSQIQSQLSHFVQQDEEDQSLKETRITPANNQLVISQYPQEFQKQVIESRDEPLKRVDLIDEKPIILSKLSFEELLNQEIQRNSIHEDTTEAKSQLEHNEIGIMESSISNNDVEDNTKNETQEDLQSIVQKPVEIKPFLKKGEGYIVKRLEGVNESKKLTESQSVNFNLEQRSPIPQKKTHQFKQVIKQTSLQSKPFSRLSTSNLQIPLNRNSSLNQQSSQKKDQLTNLKHHISVSNYNARDTSTKKMKTSQSLTITKIVEMKNNVLQQNFTSRDRSQQRKQRDLKKIYEECEQVGTSGQDTITAHLQTQEAEKEVERLLEKKKAQEKDIKTKLQSHLKMISKLKQDLKRNDSEVKNIQKSMKTGVEDLENQNKSQRRTKQSTKDRVSDFSGSCNRRNPNLHVQKIAGRSSDIKIQQSNVSQNNSKPLSARDRKSTVVPQTLGAKLRGATYKKGVPKNSITLESTNNLTETQTSTLQSNEILTLNFIIKVDLRDPESFASYEQLERKIVDEKLKAKLLQDDLYTLHHQQQRARTLNSEGTVEIFYQNEAKEYLLISGLKKRIYKDGLIVLTLPTNDIKIVSPNETNHIQCYPDGREEFIHTDQEDSQ